MPNQIDTKTISKLAEILDKNHLTGLNYEDENCKISISRDCACAPVQAIATMPSPAPVIPAAPSVAEVKEIKVDSAETIDYADNPNAVKSPMVGVVYLSSTPNSPNYVQEGDTVTAGDTICLIEAMKTFNPVKAPKSGRVVKILVESGDPVEYGESLIIIE